MVNYVVTGLSYLISYLCLKLFSWGQKHHMLINFNLLKFDCDLEYEVVNSLDTK